MCTASGWMFTSCLLFTIMFRSGIAETNMSPKMVDTSHRLLRLRSLMAQHKPKPLKAYIIPTGDAHQSEYISSHDARRAYVSGFTGSAGTAIITEDQALLWTDGRYYLQAESELDSNWQLMKESLPSTLSRKKWLIKNLPPRSHVGACPLFMANSEWEPLRNALIKAGHLLVGVQEDLVDKVWNEEGGRPPQTDNKIISLDIKYTGKTSAEKIVEVRSKMREKGADLLVITALDEVAYLLNLRGSDIPYNPVFYAYCCVTNDSVEVFTDKEMPPLDTATDEPVFNVRPYNQIFSYIRDLVRVETISPGDRDYVVWVSHSSSEAAQLSAREGEGEGTNRTETDMEHTRRLDLLTDVSPVALMKAVKNDVEAEGLENCHVRDGVALVRYFSWLEHQLTVENRTDITEISAASVLEQYRSELTDYMGLSFTTISASGPNGAVIHYHPEESTNRVLSTQEMYLCDSGAQFRDGTTDVTRTWHFGTPSQEQKESFTLVLQGQITLGATIFPYKIKGNVLDSLARHALWQMGLDYAHGTGHGVGAFLNVHEGPMGISWRQMPDDPGLQANMFLSNEPGFYKSGEYGIRLEDIVRVVTLVPPGDNNGDLPDGLRGNFAGQGALAFRTITMCPIQRKMILTNMLTKQQIDYVDSYHCTVWEKLSPLLQGEGNKEALLWLRENTRPLME